MRAFFVAGTERREGRRVFRQAPLTLFFYRWSHRLGDSLRRLPAAALVMTTSPDCQAQGTRSAACQALRKPHLRLEPRECRD